jgi:REP element-mobilizing transposase RayT
MARRPRIEFPGAFYHVIARGNNRQDIFTDDADRVRYLQCLTEDVLRSKATLYAFALMPNHVHLLVETPHAPLSSLMQRLQGRYTQYFNRRHSRVGHLFQGRYKAILCDRDVYLLELVRYIHLNPVRTGEVDDPRAARWTSHRAYLEGRASRLVETRLPLGMFSRDRPRARRAFARFVAEGIGMGHRQDLYDTIDQLYLGDEAFVARTEGLQGGRGRDQPARGAPRVRATMPRVIAAAAAMLGLPPDSLPAAGKEPRASLGRALAAHVGRTRAGLSLSALARALERDVASLSLAARRLERRLVEDAQVRRLVEGMVKRLEQDSVETAERG